MAKYSPPGVLFNNCLKFDLFLTRLFKFGIVYKKMYVELNHSQSLWHESLSYFAKKWKDIMYKRKSMVRNQDLMDYWE